MELGTYKFVRQPNQHGGKFMFRVKSFLKELLRKVTIVTALMLLATFIFLAGEWSKPEHVLGANVVKEAINFPILEKIAKCESGGKQFKSNGDVVRGKVNMSDVGKYQINEYINNDEARRLGYDIFTEKGNHDMAVYLFINQGTTPWNSSKACWSK